MKPILGKISTPAESQLMVIERREPYFNNLFHFHPECELVYVVESHGRRIVGDSIEHFEKGDLVFVGSNLPHVWYNEEVYYQGRTDLQARSVVVYFLQELFGEKFFSLEETRQLADFFQRARRGMKIYGKAHKAATRSLLRLPAQKGMDRIISLLQILQLLSETQEYEYLASIGYTHAYNPRDNHKIDEVFKFVLSNYHRDISLNEVARITNFTPQSFCRFFKNRTKKSFVQFVNEVRIGQVCRKLSEEEWSIAETAYSCGFQNLSNFNRFFKEMTGKTPKAYRQEIKISES
ncbi:AraC family transcriptional regulator [Compostibacter hankyongensis]|uniref:AraC family transcriptional regulator n=1 Tax=Compostibacter hankyongensis TaxID=1007089 RepID=A0ABP8FZA6_9BACT